jgi:HEAT repeat protein
MPKLYKTAAEKIEARLLPRLKNDPDRWCRYEIISLLGKIKSTAAIPQIQEVIQTEVAAGHEYLLEPSAEALGEIGVLNESISADLKHLISLNIDNRIRAKAIWALGELKDYSAIPLLIQELSKKTQTNENASTAFKQLLEAETNKEADKALSQVYKEQYANKEADKALGQFRREIEIKEMTVTALEGLHAVESIPYLIELYKKSPGYLNGQLRLKIVQALGNLRAKEAISLLESARHDDYNICSPQIPISSCYPVRGAAMVALKQIKNSN